VLRSKPAIIERAGQSIDEDDPMRWHHGLLLFFALPAVALASLLAESSQTPEPRKSTSPITWKKIVLDRSFRSEGVAVADVNKDGKLDILIGDVWFEAPDWKMHIMRQDRKFDLVNYSETFACFAEDINGDGWPDLICVGYPGKAATWLENPRGAPGPWKEHVIYYSACNETPLYADLFGTGKKVLIMGIQPPGKDDQGQMVWLEPGRDPTKPWGIHPISEASIPDREMTVVQSTPAGDVKSTIRIRGNEIPGTRRYSHGLGVGDINGDGRLDVICTNGWWEQPAVRDGRAWKFHPADLGSACADMVVYDIDNDGVMDVISTSAHGFGIWWHQQRKSLDGKSVFVRHDFFKDFVSQTHALHCVDINGDGLKDLVTGRRWWAHGPKGDPGSQQPAFLYWFEAKRDKSGMISFTPHQIDDDSGIGTQFTVVDLNGDGLLDIVVSNKKGTHAFLQVRAQ
jgi:hypothetical protein